jgi:hypothetical protein
MPTPLKKIYIREVKLLAADKITANTVVVGEGVTKQK